MKKITIWKTENWKTKERVIMASSVEFKDNYIIFTLQSWVIQALANFNNIIVEDVCK